jgi:hypothetical protein
LNRHLVTATLLVVALLSSPAEAAPANAAAPAFRPTAADEREPLEQLLQRGVDAAARRDWDAAIRYYSAAHHVAPANAESLFDLGLANSQVAGRELPAIAWFNAYIAASPTDSRIPAIRQQIVRLREAATAHAVRLLELADKAVVPLPPGDRWLPAVTLAGTAARLGDSDRMLRSLTRWRVDAAQSLEKEYFGTSMFLQYFAQVVDPVGPDSAVLPKALDWETGQLAAALQGGAGKPKVFDNDVPTILSALIVADAKLGRIEDANRFLTQLRNKVKPGDDPDAIVGLVQADIALTKETDARTDLATWRRRAEANRYWSGAHGDVIVGAWVGMHERKEAKDVIDFTHARVTALHASAPPAGTPNSTVRDRYVASLEEAASAEHDAITIMKMNIQLGDISAASDALGEAWRALRTAQAAILQYSRSAPRDHHPLDEANVVDDFCKATLELGRALQQAGEQAELGALTSAAFSRARIEAQEETKDPALRPLPNYSAQQPFMFDRGYLRAYALERRLRQLIELLALNDDIAGPEHATQLQFLHDQALAIHSTGAESSVLFDLAELKLSKLGDRAAQADVLAAVRDVQECHVASSYGCFFGRQAGLLLFLPDGEKLFRQHLRDVEGSEVWKGISSSFATDTARHYEHLLRHYAAGRQIGALTQLADTDRARAWASLAEWGLSDTPFLGEGEMNASLLTVDGSLAWSYLNDWSKMTMDQLALVSGGR